MKNYSYYIIMKVFKKHKSKKSKTKIIAKWIIAMIIVNGLLIFFGTNIRNTVFTYSESEIRAKSRKAVNNAVNEIISNKNIYDDLINILTDSQGNILLIQANSLQINLFSNDLVKTSQKKLENIGADGIDIPIGTISGITLFSGKGPKINFKFIPVGEVTCEFKSEFKSTGINQTIHKLYANIDTNVNIILPLSSNNVKTTTSILICESVIVGQVPEVYLNSTKLDNLLNLVP